MLSSDLDIRRLIALRAVEAGLLRLKWLAAAKRFELAMVRHHRALKLAYKYGYNPNQPRDDHGRWTYVDGYARVAAGGRSGGGGRSRYGGYFPGASHSQLVRLDLNIARTESALQQIRQYDSNWRPTTTSLTSPGSIEGEIRSSEARAIEAEARLQELRTGIGGNYGPPLEPAPARAGGATLSSSGFDGQAWINAYRTVNNAPDLFGRPSWTPDEGTVAVSKIDGKLYFGINSTAPGYDTKTDRFDADAMRSTLLTKYPDMRSENIGSMPNNSVYHAEATLLMRVARENDGSLAGRSIEIQVDRRMCESCAITLPRVGLELGNPTVTFVNVQTGQRATMQNGRWFP